MSIKARNYLAEEIVWRKNADPLRPYAADLEGRKSVIRINDFPEEHLYTLIVGDAEIADFSDWPAQWTRP